MTAPTYDVDREMLDAGGPVAVTLETFVAALRVECAAAGIDAEIRAVHATWDGARNSDVHYIPDVVWNAAKSRACAQAGRGGRATCAAE